MSLEWLNIPVHENGEVVVEPLNVDLQDSTTSRALCEHMLSLIDLIEHKRCEGRLMPAEIYNGVDLLLVDLERGNSVDHNAVLAWAEKLGDYYSFTGLTQINVDEWWSGFESDDHVPEWSMSTQLLFAFAVMSTVVVCVVAYAIWIS